MFKKYNEQEGKEQRALLIGGVIASAEFKKIITEAVKQGVGEDWGYDGEDEYPYDTFDEDVATESVIEALKKHLL